MFFLFPYRLGGHKREGDKSKYVQDFNAAKILPHADFVYSPGSGYDIALIKLDKRAELNEAVWPICLPDKTITPEMQCWVTGWGQSNRDPWYEHPSSYERVLQEAAVEVVSW